MAIYHLSAKIISRSEGKSATAASAYRSGSVIHDRNTGEIHDYTRKGGVDHSEIIAPEGAPDWATNREDLWNAVESIEKRKDAQVCREIELAIPVELSDDQKKSLVIDFVKQTFVDAGMVADVAFHKLDSGNPHAHILLTTREIGPDGFGGKNRDWNQKPLLESWRKGWEEAANKALESEGHESRIDHRSLKDQGIDRDPTTHLGPEATGYERRTGEKSEKRKRHESRLDQAKLDQAKPETYLERIKREAAEREAERAKNPRLYDWRKRLDDRRSAWGRSYIEAVAPDYSKARPVRGKVQPVVYRWKEGKAKGYAAVLDYGDRIKPAGNPESISDAKIEIMLDLAVQKGWPGVAVFGHRDFRERVAEMADRRGIPLLDDDLRQGLEMRREAEDRERRIKAMNQELTLKMEKEMEEYRQRRAEKELEERLQEKIEKGMEEAERKADELLDKNDQLILGDGRLFLFLGSFQQDGSAYAVLSDTETEKEWIVPLSESQESELKFQKTRWCDFLESNRSSFIMNTDEDHEFRQSQFPIRLSSVGMGMGDGRDELEIEITPLDDLMKQLQAEIQQGIEL